MSGCNSVGCSDAGLGPHIGGIQWEHWDINFDFLAMAYDVPAANLQFSIGGVVKLLMIPTGEIILMLENLKISKVFLVGDIDIR